VYPVANFLHRTGDVHLANRNATSGCIGDNVVEQGDIENTD